MTRRGIVALGAGNILFSDDGVGVHVIQALANHHRVPRNVRLVDGGTLGLDLMPIVASCDRLLIIDAVDTGAAPGAIVQLGADAVLGRRPAATCHSLGIPDLIAASKLAGICPEEVVILGIQPALLGVGIILSDEVQAALGKAIEDAIGILTGWQKVD